MIEVNLTTNMNNLDTELQDDKRTIDADVEPITKVAQTDHAKLKNLDYSNSGHTGFAAERLSVYPQQRLSTNAERISTDIFANKSGVAIRVNMQEIKEMNTKIEVAENVDNVNFDKLTIGDYIYIDNKN